MSEQTKKEKQEPSASPENTEWNVAVAEGIRRFPFYLLLDTSAQMTGAPLKALKLGLEQFKKEVGDDPFAEETVYVGIITFGGEAKFVTKGLVPFDRFRDEFQIESLSAGGGTSLGRALWLLSESLDKDVKGPAKGGEKGDWKPLIFILIGSEPADDWRPAKEAILSQKKNKVMNVITVGCGSGVSQETLKGIAIGPVFDMSFDDPSLKSFLQWIDWDECELEHPTGSQNVSSPNLTLESAKKRKEVIQVSEQTKKEKQEPSTSPENVEWNVAVSEGVRRLPIYLLLDTSGSMAGAPIQAVRLGVEQFKKDAGSDSYAEETIFVGIITFGQEAQFVTKGLMSFDKFRDDFQTDSLSANGQTPLGQALWLLSESLDKDVKGSVKGGEKGDWKPLVYILTDGEPTDDWKAAREAILNRQKKRVINVITVGCGPTINQQNLKEIAIGPTWNMGNDEASFKNFFQWVTQTAVTVAKSVSKPGGGDKPTDTPPPPEGMQYIP